MPVAEHPEKHKKLKIAAQRFFALRDSHFQATEFMWVGLLVSSFTEQELALLKDYLSVADQRNLQRMRRKFEKVNFVTEAGPKLVA